MTELEVCYLTATLEVCSRLHCATQPGRTQLVGGEVMLSGSDDGEPLDEEASFSTFRSDKTGRL